jgi:nitronate monooxygenase
MASASDVRRALDAGAVAAVLGTRFLLTSESAAHPGYKARVLEAERTLLTELFGLGWSSAPHRVVPNAATERWAGGDGRGPRWAALLGRAAAPLAPRLAGGPMTARQRQWLPLFSPEPPLEDSPERLLDAAPLYAGESALRIERLEEAGPLTRELAGAA